jgi:hypothetical protein
LQCGAPQNNKKTLQISRGLSSYKTNLHFRR